MANDPTKKPQDTTSPVVVPPVDYSGDNILQSVIHSAISGAGTPITAPTQRFNRGPGGELGQVIGSTLAGLFHTPWLSGQMNKPQQPGEIDVTDPRLHPGEERVATMTPEELRVRRARALGEGIRLMTTRGVGGLLPGAAINDAITNGDISPIDDEERKIYGFWAPILTSSGLFGAASLAGGGIAALTGGGAAAAGAETAGAAAAEATTGGLAQVAKGAAIGTGVGAGVGTAFGAAQGALDDLVQQYQQNPSSGFTDYLSKVDPSQLAAASWAGAKGGALFGGALGGAAGAWGASAPILARLLEPTLSPEAKAIIMDEVNNGGSHYFKGPGVIIDGKRAEEVGGKVIWRFIDGPNVGKEGEAPSVVTQNGFVKNAFFRAKQAAMGSPEGQVFQQAVANLDPTRVETLPPDLEPEAQQMQTIGAMYWRDQGRTLTDRVNRSEVSKVVAQRELEILKTKMLDPTLTVQQRVTYGGRVVALQRALGHPQEIQGKLTFEEEYAALNLVRRLQPGGGLAAVESAANELGGAHPQLQKRVLEIARTNRAEPLHKEVTDALRKANSASYNGLRRGSTVAYEGEAHQVVDRPGYGLVALKRLNGPQAGEIHYVDVSELTFQPKAGSVIKLQDGKVVRVGQVQTESNSVAGTDTQTGQQVVTELDNVVAVSDAPAQERIIEHEAKANAAVTATGAEEVIPTKAVTTTGEPVIVEKVSAKAVRVRDSKGRYKTLPKGEVVPATNTGNAPEPFTPEKTAEMIEALKRENELLARGRTEEADRVANERLAAANATNSGQVAPEKLDRWKDLASGKITREEYVAQKAMGSTAAAAPMQPRQILTMAPGKIPSEGNRMLYTTVKAESVEAFERDYQNGTLTPEKLADHLIDVSVSARGEGKGKVTTFAHVLPQDMMEGHEVQYGIELPRELTPMKNYSGGAKEAVAALGGKGKLGDYSSAVRMDPATFTSGQLYRIPPEMQKANVLPTAELQDMTQADQTSYLQKLLTFSHAEMNHEVAQATAEVRQAVTQQADAVVSNDGTKLAEAEHAQVEATAAAVEAHLDNVHSTPAAEGILPSLRERVFGSGLDPAIPARQEFENQGFTEATGQVFHDMLDNLKQADPRGIEDEINVAPSANVEGQRMYIVKRGRLAYAEGEAYTLPYWELTPMTADAGPLREAAVELASPTEVSQYLQKNGYIPTLYKLFNAQYTHSGRPTLVAGMGEKPVAKSSTYGLAGDVRVNPEGSVTAQVLKRTELGGTTPEQREASEVAVQVGERHQDITSGETRLAVKMEVRFANSDLAHQWMTEQGFVRSEQKGNDLTLVGRFQRLPKMEELYRNPNGLMNVNPRREYTGKVYEQEVEGLGTVQRKVYRTVGQLPVLKVVESNLQEMIEHAIRINKNVPDALVEYAADFSKIFYETYQEAAFDRSTRKAIGLPALSDLAQNPNPQSMDLSQANMPNIPFTKGMNYPVPETFEGKEGFSLDALSLDGDLPSEMHTHVTTTRVPDDHRTIYGRVQGVPGKWMPGLQEATSRAAQEAYYTKWRSAYVEAERLTEGENLQTPTHLLRVYKPTGQVVRIVGDLGTLTNGEVKISLPDGQEMSVASELLGESASKQKDAHDFAVARSVVDGSYSRIFKHEPPIGYGEVEQSLGMLGVRNRNMLSQALGTRAAELASELEPAGLGGKTLRGPQANVEALARLYNRAQWIEPQLGAPTRTPVGEGLQGPAQQEFTPLPDLVMEAVRSVDPKLEGAFRQYAYEQARANFGDNPWGNLLAKVQSGLWKANEAEAGALNELRTLLGRAIPKAKHGESLSSFGAAREQRPGSTGSPEAVVQKMPDHELLAEGMRRGLLDPVMMRQASLLNNERGAVGTLLNLNLPPTVKIRFAKPGGTLGHLSQNWGVPHRVLLRNPLTSLMMNAVQDADIAQHAFFKSTYGVLEADIAKNAHLDLSFQSQDSKVLQNALETFDDFEQSGLDPKYEYAFNRMRKYYADRKFEHITYFLRRQISPTFITQESLRGNTKLRNFLHLHDIDTDNMADGFAWLSKDPAHELGIEGETKGQFTHDEISSFVNDLKTYDTAADLPDGYDPRFREMFDFWKRYGIKNYVPHIFNGNIGIYRTLADGSKQIVGITPSLWDGAQAVRAMVDNKTLHPSDNITFETHGEVYDDIDSRVMAKMGRREYDQAVKSFSEFVKNEGDQITALFLRGEGTPPKQPGKGFLSSAQPRQANIVSPYRDLMTDTKVMTARIGRAEYRFKLSQAHQMLEDRALDQSLAKVYNTNPLHGSDQVADRNLLEAARDQLETAAGAYTRADQRADIVMRYVRWASHVPEEAMTKMIGRDNVDIPWKEILSPSSYHVKYAGRGSAAASVSFNALMKLGATPASAIFNYFQFLTNAFPLAMRNGVSVGQALMDGVGAFKDGHKLWYGNTFGGEVPSHLKAIYPYLQRIGVDLSPGKQLVGGGGAGSWSDLAGSMPKALTHSKLEYAGELGKWAAMLPFNAGEEIGRFSTALMSMRQELRAAGINWESAAEIAANPEAAGRAAANARHMVDKTFFHYDALGMPQQIQRMGPIGRTAFQFKSYIIQQSLLELDYMKNLGTANGWRQMGAHMATHALLAGTVGLSYHPALNAIGALTKYLSGKDMLTIAGHKIPLTPEAIATLSFERHQRLQTPNERMANSMHYNWKDLVDYGLPGLLHVSLGPRLGANPEEFIPDFSNPSKMGRFFLGPTYSRVFDYLNLMGRYVAAQNTNRAATIGGAALGATAAMALGRRINYNTPVTGFIGAMAGSALATIHANNPFQHFLANSKEGKQMLLDIIPSEARNLSRSWDVMHSGELRSLSDAPTYIPHADRAMESFAQGIGLNSIRRQEYEGYLGFTNAASDRIQSAKSNMIGEIARYRRDGDKVNEWRTMIAAGQAGIVITAQDIDHEMNNLSMESYNQHISHQSAQTRNLQP